MAYLEKNPAIAKLVVGLTALLTIGGPVLAMLGAMSSGIGALLGNVSKISGAISGLGGLLRTFMAGPVGLVIAGVAAVVAGLVLLYNKSKTFREAVNGLVGALGADETDDAKVEEKITWLIENMSPSSANVLKTLITPKMLQKYKIPAETSEKIANALGTMLTKMADSDAMTPEEYKNEAEAIKYFYHVAIDASKGTGNTIFGGRLPEASVLLDRLMSSKVLSATVVETVYGPNGDEYNEDPMGVSGKVSENDRATWGNEIEAYADAHPGADLQTLKALGLIFGYEMN
jgi:hypothetical protein